MSEKESLLSAIYDPSSAELEFTSVTLEVSTLVYDRINTACSKTNLDPDTFIRVALFRALLDYEQFSNSI